MKKRGQITIFIIIGLLISVIFIVLFINRDKLGFLNRQGPEFSSEINKINQIMNDCVKQRAVDAIRLAGLQGGYIILPENYLPMNISNVAFGYYKGEKTLPSKKIIEKEISTYVEITIPFCLDNEEFPDINITKGKSYSEASMENNYVLISARLPLSIKKENNAFTINNAYKHEIPIKLGGIYDAANEIINKEIIEPESIDLSYLGSLDYHITILQKDEENIVYMITDDSEINNIPYSFIFANKFKSN